MLSVVVPTRNKASRLQLSLRALQQAAGSADVERVIVVDDASDDGTRAVLDEARARFGDLLLPVRLDAPAGRSTARNVGAGKAGGDRVLFLDDDMLVGAELLRRHAELADDQTRRVLARGRILHFPWLRHLDRLDHPCRELPPLLADRVRRLIASLDQPDQLHVLARRTKFEGDLHRLLRSRAAERTGRWPASTGGNLSISRSFFQELGGFDAELGIRWGVEDLELGLRAEQRGAVIEQLEDVVAFHLDHPTRDRDRDHSTNLAYFGRKHGALLGDRLADYFAGSRPLEEVVTC